MDEFTEEQADRLIEAADKALQGFQEVARSPEFAQLQETRRKLGELGIETPDDLPPADELRGWRRLLQWTRKEES